MSYGEYIFQQLITSDFIQRKLTSILVALVANIISLHVSSLLCLVLTTRMFYIDFIVQIVISIVISINVDFIYKIVIKWEEELHRITKYFIKNYTFENYKRWKRYIIITGCGYLCIIVYFAELSKPLIYTYILQYIICFIIIEQIETKSFKKWTIKVFKKPKVNVFELTDDTDLINSYYAPIQRPVQRPVQRQISQKDLKNSITGSNNSRKNNLITRSTGDMKNSF